MAFTSKYTCLAFAVTRNPERYHSSIMRPIAKVTLESFQSRRIRHYTQPRAWILLKVCPLTLYVTFSPRTAQSFSRLMWKEPSVRSWLECKDLYEKLTSFIFVALETHRSRLLACPDIDWFFINIFREKGLKPVIMIPYKHDVPLPDSDHWRKWTLPRQQFDMAWIPP